MGKPISGLDRNLFIEYYITYANPEIGSHRGSQRLAERLSFFIYENTTDNWSFLLVKSLVKSMKIDVITEEVGELVKEGAVNTL